MTTLYILGNGFDIYHCLDTRYQSFARYIAGNNNEVYDLLTTYYGLPNIKNPNLTDEEYALWSRFEEALADLDYETILEDNSNLIANPGAEDFRDRDLHSYQIEMELIITSLTTTLIQEFNKFILEIDYNKIEQDKNLTLEDDSVFLSFNYTETLQKFYNISQDNITYIHNKADFDICNLELGHGTNPENFIEPNEEPPKDLSDEELELWREQKSDEYDYSYDSAKQEILTYYTKAFKNTVSIIEQNRIFFDNLTPIEKVYILGHSISQVDIKYFEELKKNLNENVVWHVTFYGEVEKQKHIETLLKLGIKEDKIKQIKIEELKKDCA
jgi:Bacteriophage abortive infection AbiH